MNLSDSGIRLIKQFERLRLTAYDDGYGNRTIGWGHLIQPGENLSTITAAEADSLLSRDLATAESAVNSLVRVPLTQSQYDALVSLVFNWGVGNFSNSSHLSLLNSGDYTGAAARLREFPITSGGAPSQGLVNRRKAEADLFLRDGIFPLPSSPTTPAPVPGQPVTEQTDSSVPGWLYPAAGIAITLLLVALIDE